MAIQLDNITQSLLNKALDVSMQTHRVIANNVANVNTEGYQPLKVDFASVMAGVADHVKNGDSPETLKAALDSMNVNQHVYADSSHDSVQLEQEMVDMAQNTLRYQAIIDVKKSLGSIMAIAINGGKV